MVSFVSLRGPSREEVLVIGIDGIDEAFFDVIYVYMRGEQEPKGSLAAFDSSNQNCVILQCLFIAILLSNIARRHQVPVVHTQLKSAIW